jgi:hypothetical protein
MPVALNIEHPTPNTQHPTFNGLRRITRTSSTRGSETLDVGCSMLGVGCSAL